MAPKFDELRISFSMKRFLVCLVKPNLKGHDLNGAVFQTPAVYVGHCAHEMAACTKVFKLKIFFQKSTQNSFEAQEIHTFCLI